MKGSALRHSKVVYTLIRLPLRGGSALLLRRHEKWGDWSLVGGHVEDDELHDWSLAASREATEEMVPLRAGTDFRLEPMHDEPITWGPEASRSAQGARTVYHIQYFDLVFLRDPVELLGRLDPADFLLITEEQLGSTPHALGNPVFRARRYLEGGFDAVPHAWHEPLDPDVLPKVMLAEAATEPPAGHTG